MKIVFLDEYSIAGANLDKIKELGEYAGYDYTATLDELLERSATAEVIITNKNVINRDTMLKLPSLKLICVAATGTNNIDMESAQELGIEVRNAVGYSTTSVAEATLGYTLALYRQIAYYDHFVKGGDYAASPRQFNFDRRIYELRGKKWGVIGLGNIGREVARLATAFGCEVKYHSTSGAERKEDYPPLSLDELLAWSDIVSVHAPLNAATRGLIGEAEFAKMKSSAIVVNVARGNIIDEAWLAQALDSEQIAGAALDVFSKEPILDGNPLTKLKDKHKILLSPHTAWSAVEAMDNLVDAIYNNINSYKNN